MGRKVFISVQGTGIYRECTYAIDGNGEKGDFNCRTRFIQEATLKYLMHEGLWDKSGEVYILLTEKARKNNWEDKKDGGSIVKGLRGVLEDMNLDGSHVHDVTIKEGLDEDELWEIFDAAYGCMQSGDELYFDITHGFRYLPMLVLILGNYAEFLKGTTVKSITYGNWDVSDQGTKPAPIIDLLPLAELQHWAFAAADFVENGNTKKLKKLIHSICKAYHIEGRIDERDSMSNLWHFVLAAEKFTDEMKFCRGLSTLEATSYANMIRCNCGDTAKIIRPLPPIMESIIASAEGFSGERDVRNCFAAAEWCYDKGQFQAAATELEEAIVSFFCFRHGIDVNDEDGRPLVNSAIAKSTCDHGLCKTAYRPLDQESEVKVDKIAKDEFLGIKDILNAFNELCQLRNDYNHAGMRKKTKPLKPDKMKKKIGKLIGIFKEAFFKQEAAQQPTEPTPDDSEEQPAALLVNLSNHPYASWSDEQKEASKAYGGEVVDLDFPQVDPEASEEELQRLSDEMTQKIMEQSQAKAVTVHVMGEMGLTVLLVSALKEKGIPCIYSTTIRISETLPDGSMRKEFHFQRFRKYA